MKKTLAFLIIAAMCVAALANGLLVITLKDGSIYEFYLDEIESLVYVADDELPLESQSPAKPHISLIFHSDTRTPEYQHLKHTIPCFRDYLQKRALRDSGLTPGSESSPRIFHMEASRKTTCTTFSMLTSVA